MQPAMHEPRRRHDEAIPATTERVATHAGLATLLTVAALFFGVAASAHAQTWTASSYAARLTDLLNSVRDKHGLHPLTVTTGTSNVAAGWTSHMAAHNSLEHNGDLVDDLVAHGSRDWHVIEENVGEG